ncbi:MAG: adenylosuccinate lyase [Candidatus Omnitrophica bacterium]|nr:adenylosuccinate lyase [Candidatus Omnitrophota bacterium]
MIERYTLEKMRNIWSRENKFSKMLQVEILTCEALSHSKVIPLQALRRIKRKAKFNIKRIDALEKKTNHDVVAFLLNLGEGLGEDAKFLHRGLTSSDVLDTALSMQLRESCDILLDDLEKLRKILAKKARQYKHTPCIGRTHGIHAEPLAFGLKFALWFDEINRALLRMRRVRELVSLVKLSGAVGTYVHLPASVEKYVASRLKLKSVNAATQVISRDIHAEFVSSLALVAASIEKFATEIRHLQRTEVREAEEPFGRGQKGSSAMPHKRNPIICERLCGLSRIIRSYVIAALENVSLWHERDISHSSVERVILADSCQVLDYMLVKFTNVVSGLLVYPQAMLANLAKTRGLIFSQGILVRLMQKGLAREKAYDIVQDASMHVWKNIGATFMDVLLVNSKARRYLSEKEIKDCFSLNYYLRNVDNIFKKVGL